MKKSDTKRAQWMKAFENAVVSAWPETAGKLDWNTATYLFNSGRFTAQTAAEQYVKCMRPGDSE